VSPRLRQALWVLGAAAAAWVVEAALTGDAWLLVSAVAVVGVVLTLWVAARFVRRG
jgi:hypothetical protein